MQEDEANRVSAALRARGVMAKVARPSPFRFSIRVPLGDGREAVWGAAGSSGLEAQVMRNGMLVGFVPDIPGSEHFDHAQTVEAIATADYGPA